MRPPTARARRLTAALCCGALLFTAGCGGDDENAGETDATPLTTVPRENTAPPATTTAPPQTQTTPPPQTAPEDSGGSTAPAPPDSPENDRKPAPGTPESKFEEFCDQNPGACG